MKVRISDQSLRVRITEAEAQLLNEGIVLNTCLQINAIDLFSIELKSWHLTIGEIQLDAKSILISIPQEASEKLLHERGYSYAGEQQATAKSTLNFIVEIDLEKASQP